jgi:hypothetical protein
MEEGTSSPSGDRHAVHRKTSNIFRDFAQRRTDER